jgi:hypothetical protein
MPKARNPRTPGEWQEAVDIAEFFLLLDSSNKYGLTQGGPGINVDRCEAILKEGRAIGYRPASAKDLAARFIPQLLRERKAGA